MNILVTGGAGFIGSVTTESLIQRGHKVTVLDNLVTGHRAAVHPDAAFVQADVADTEGVAQAIKEHNIEATLHFAAYSLVGESMAQPAKYFQNNSAGTLKLLETLLEYNVKKFVLSSTAALFGKPESLPISEDAAIQPGSVYGESKYLTERMLGWLNETQDLGFVALRYFNAAGASETYGEDHRPESHLIPITLQVAQGKRDYIGIFGDDYDTRDGTCVRDYVHVLDLAQAHILALEALQEGEARRYNLGSGRGFSVREVIDVCREVTGHVVPEKVQPRRPGDPAALVADSGLIRRELGWRPERESLREMVASAWTWFGAHPDGYEDKTEPGAV